MNVPEIIRDVARAGGRLNVDQGDLIISAPAPLPPSLVDKVKRHKAELLATLSGPTSGNAAPEGKSPRIDEIANPLAICAAEGRQRRVLAMLAERPGVRYAVLLTLAIRGVGTCELAIPRAKYDGVLLLDLIDKHCGTVH